MQQHAIAARAVRSACNSGSADIGSRSWQHTCGECTVHSGSQCHGSYYHRGCFEVGKRLQQVCAATGGVRSAWSQAASGIGGGSQPQHHKERTVGYGTSCLQTFKHTSCFEPGKQVQQHVMAMRAVRCAFVLSIAWRQQQITAAVLQGVHDAC